MDLTIEKTLVCSTSHYTENDDKVLSRIARKDCSCVHATDAGFTVRTNPELGIDTVLWLQLSAAFDRVMQLAASNECDAVRFDRDAPAIDGLQTFEW